MKVKAVSVFRERGLRAGVSRRAEPQCLVGNANIERKTDTMKSYILLKPEAVQSQIITAPAEAKPSVLFIGLDVHNDSIAVSIAPGDSTEVRRYGIIGGEHDDVLKLVKKLQAAHPGGILKICYEAGPRGFALCRCLRSHGLDCLLVCPSQVPRKPGERVKTDRRGMPTNWRACCGPDSPRQLTLRCQGLTTGLDIPVLRTVRRRVFFGRILSLPVLVDRVCNPRSPSPARFSRQQTF